jgi:hypothetical protein
MSLPDSVRSFQERVLEGVDYFKTKKLLIFIFGCAVWSLLLIRNDFVFNNIVVSSPEVCVYRCISFMQRWAILNKEEGRLRVDEALQRLQHRHSSWRSDVGD